MGSCPGGELSWWSVVPVGKCAGGGCPSGELSWWGLVLVGYCPGGSCPVGSCPRTCSNCCIVALRMWESSFFHIVLILLINYIFLHLTGPPQTVLMTAGKVSSNMRVSANVMYRYAFIPSITFNIVFISVIMIFIRIMYVRSKRFNNLRRDELSRNKNDSEPQFAETYQELSAPPSAFAETYQELNSPPSSSHLHTLKTKSGEDVEYHYYCYPDKEQTMAAIGMVYQPSGSQEGSVKRVPNPNDQTLKHNVQVGVYSLENEIDDGGYLVPHEAFCMS